ncbi:MAG TPA: BMP family ABC transporter substrate-binding protein [Gaiellaceae bacterium]|nr:BMP family ABC transporter substrate-binding protein [Gaiellaceae bacterium]
MRKTQLLVTILACGLLAFAAACGGDDDEGGGAGGGTTATETAGGEGIRVGLVSDVGRFNDRSFNQSALEGLQRAEQELGITGRPVESRQTSDYVPNLSSLARQGFDLTIGVGFLLAEAVNTAAKRFPDAKFAIIDYSVNADPFTKNPNVQGLTFATNENSYMIGCLAGLMAEKQGGKQVISAVGGIKLPTVDIFIAGYQAGAKECNPKITTLIGYSQDFVAQDKCKEIALNQIAQGSQVIFQVAGGCGLGALDAAKERGKWGIGVDRDQSNLGAHILTSAVKRVDQSVFLTAEAVKNGEFKGGEDAVFDLENEGVGIGKISPKVPQEFVDRMNEIKDKLISGELTAPATL